MTNIIASTAPDMSSTLSTATTRTSGFSDFHGGIHPPEMKSLSNQTTISQAPIPPLLILPVQQHIGAAAKVCVSVGDKVLKGQRIAEAEGYVSAHVHAPTSGVVESIGDHILPHASGQSGLSVTIKSDGEDTWCERDTEEDYLALPTDLIQAKVRAAGITGMGGAGFPTDIKLSPPETANIDTLILNAAECEPYITSDDRLIRERADQVIEGLRLSAKVLQPSRILIGIEDNKPEAVAALELALQEVVKNEAFNPSQPETSVEICVVPTKYPSGGEKQLIKLLTDKEVPSGKIPADIGIVCQNVGTIVAIYRAVRFGEPLISRITTLTGLRIQQRGNVEVLLGTPIDWLLSHYDYQPAKRERLIMGGPMMGFTLSESNVPVVKATNCILAPNETELALPEAAMACIRCGLCAEACPAELLPQQLYWFARGQEYEKAEHHNLFDCIECGACSFVCPSAIPLVQYYRHAKGEIKQHQADQAKSDQARERFEARQARLEREAAEKEAKRKARAEAAAKAQAAKRAAEEAAAKAGGGDASDSKEGSSEQVDPKKAAVAEALARAQAKKADKQGEQPEEKPDPEALKEAWDKAQAKLEKMLDALENAKENNPEQVEKLTRAVEKNQMRVNQAKQAFEKVSQAPEPVQADVQENVSEKKEAIDQEAVDALKLAVEKAEAKLVKMEDALANAAPEQVEKLTRAVDKNKVRVEQAKQAYADGQNKLSLQNQKAQEQAVQEQAEPVDIEALETALEKAQNKLAKMEDALANAQPEQVEKLTRAVDKNKVRVQVAKDELDKGRAQQFNSGQARVDQNNSDQKNSDQTGTQDSKNEGEA